MNFSAEKIESFFTKILAGLKKTRNVTKIENQKDRKILQLLEEAIEENEFETLETFFDLIKQKRYNFDEINRNGG